MTSRGRRLARLARPGVLWWLVFLYTVLAGLLVQFILLPYVLPSWHAGNGLLKGVDAPELHKIAIDLAAKVEAMGWREWIPAPDGQIVSGVAALAYVLIYPAPWAVLPLNGALNACACVGVFLILRRFSPDPPSALLATLPFAFFPSNLIWNAQLHNENYAVPGVIGILFGWFLVVTMHLSPGRRQAATAAAALGSILAGSFLLGVVRSQILDGMTFLCMIAGAALACTWLLQRPPLGTYVARLALVAAASGVMLLAGLPKVSDGVLNLPATTSINVDLPKAADQAAVTERPRKTKTKDYWMPTAALPPAVDHRLQDLASFRNRFIRSWADSGSAIDPGATFHKAADLVAYAPRALQIGLFSPFPDMWFTSSEKPAGTGMRFASAFEMLLAYALMLGLPFFIWQNRAQPAAWMVLFVCLSMLVVYAAIIPNVGALYRFRYPYFMPLVCMGLLGWISHLRSRTERRSSGTPA